MMIMRVLLSLLFVLIVFPALSQNGSIQGKVSDAVTGESLVGASVLIQGTFTGTITNLDGLFELKNVAPGTYNIVVSYISYDKQILMLEVSGGKVGYLDVKLGAASLTVDEVTVTARKRTSTEAAMVVNIKSIDLIANGITADQIKKSQDSDAAEVMRRVPGITITDGKFVVVRGLSERYNSVLLNGAPAPSFEPSKRSFSFDAIPSGMIENIMIYKSPAPELPADFAGAVIDILTNEVADKNSFKLSYSSGYVQNTSFIRDFQTYQGGRFDRLGFDDGTRDFPAELPSTQKMTELYKWPNLATYVARMDSLKIISRAFNKNWDTHTINPFLDQSIGLTAQRRFLLGKVSVGNITSLTYKATSNFNIVRRAEYESYNAITDDIDMAYDFDDYTYVQDASLGLIHNWLFVFGNNQKIGLRNLANNLGESRTVQRQGYAVNSSQDWRSTNLRFNQRFIYSGQLDGKHHINNNKTRFNWTAGLSYTSNNDPDNRRYTYARDIYSPDTIPYFFVIDNKPSVYNGGRLSQSLVEWDKNFKFDVTHDIYTSISQHPVQIKAGVFSDSKSRDVDTRMLGIVAPRGTNKLALTGGLFQEVENLVADTNFYYNPANINVTGLAYMDGTNSVNTYEAVDDLFASYVGVKLPIGEIVDIYGGVRMERYSRLITGFYQKTSDASGNVLNDSLDINRDTLSLFPSLNMKIKLGERHNIRLSYGKTVNRPEFRENSVSFYEDFELNSLVYGNSDLVSATIQSYDIRYEWYPSPGEMISVAGFYKDFSNPIELFQILAGNKFVYQPYNTEKAFSRGIEFDARKSLMFLEDVPVLSLLKNLTVVFNSSLIKSEINTNISFSRDSVRIMQGQSPYIVNLGLFYNNPEKGLMMNLSYNRIGKRIMFVGTPLNPHTWELPRNSIDLSIEKKIGEHFDLKLGIKDLTNSPVHWVEYFGANDNIEVTKLKYVPNRKINLGVTWTF